MDLDNIKKKWQGTEIKSAIDNEKIKKMISNEGKSSLDRLIRYEKLGLWALIPFGLIAIFLCTVHISVFILSVCMIIGGAIWQLFKLRYLKKLDMVHMGILEISARVNRYRLYINREIIAGAVIVFLFFALYIFYTSNPVIYDFETIKYLLFRFLVTVIIGLTIALLLYKYMYVENIKKLQESIKEVEEFEKDNL